MSVFSPSSILVIRICQTIRASRPYAEIVVKGKVVATIDNQGIAVSKDPAWSERYRDVMGSLNGTVGPDLAERTAKAIAKALGGRVVKQETALTTEF